MIIDIIVIAIIALSAFLGYKKGLVSILVSFAGMIIAIVLAFILQGPVADFLYNTPIGSSIEQGVTKVIEENVQQENNNDNENFITKILNSKENSQDINKAAESLTKYILKGISFVGILILVFIICYILQMVLNLVFDLPLLNSVNRLGGIGLNIIKTLIKLWVLLAIISFISAIPIVKPVVDVINDSMLVKLLYDNNFLVAIIQGTMKL